MKLIALLATAILVSQGPTLSQNVRQYVRTSAPVIALTNVRIIDGTGQAARERQTVIVRDGLIAQAGDASSIPLPRDAEVIDLTGKTMLPGLVMLHEHFYYPTGPGVYGQLGESFSR